MVMNSTPSAPLAPRSLLGASFLA